MLGKISESLGGLGEDEIRHDFEGVTDAPLQSAEISGVMMTAQNFANSQHIFIL
jgi:hypothetical protein